MKLRAKTVFERIAALEADGRTDRELLRDLEARLLRVEKLVWGLVALQLGLKYLL